MLAHLLVYRGRDNEIEATFSQFDPAQGRLVPFDFSTTTRMVLTFPYINPVLAFDSQLIPGVMDWSQGGGKVVFDISGYSLPIGVYRASLVSYDPVNSGGLVIVDAADFGTNQQALEFDVRETLAAGLTPPPLPTGGEAVVRQAGETISALKAVYELDGQVFALDSQDVDHAPLYLGIAVSSATTGLDVVIQRAGTIDEGTWSWPGGEVFVGLAGTLTAVPPITGFKLIVGNSPSPQRINMTFDTPVYL